MSRTTSVHTLYQQAHSCIDLVGAAKLPGRRDLAPHSAGSISSLSTHGYPVQSYSWEAASSPDRLCVGCRVGLSIPELAPHCTHGTSVPSILKAWSWDRSCLPRAGNSALDSHDFTLYVMACTWVTHYTCAKDFIAPVGAMWDVRPGWWGRERKRKASDSFKGGSRQNCREGALEAVFFSQRLRGWLLNLVTGLK